MIGAGNANLSQPCRVLAGVTAYILPLIFKEVKMKLADMIKLGMNGFKPADIKQLNNSGMTTDEIINLTKSGYSVADAVELIAMAGNDEEVQPGNDGKEDPQGPAELPGNEGDQSKNDYIEKINAQEQELEKLKKTLETVQQQNSVRNLGGADPKDPREEVKEIFRQIY